MGLTSALASVKGRNRFALLARNEVPRASSSSREVHRYFDATFEKTLAFRQIRRSSACRQGLEKKAPGWCSCAPTTSPPHVHLDFAPESKIYPTLENGYETQK